MGCFGLVRLHKDKKFINSNTTYLLTNKSVYSSFIKFVLLDHARVN